MFGPKAPLTPVPLGGRQQFACGFSGCPVPTVIWKRNGRVLDADGRIGITTYEIPTRGSVHATSVLSTLTINSVSLDDHGEYECVGQNDYGSTEGYTGPIDLTARISVVGGPSKYFTHQLLNLVHGAVN